MGKLKKQRRRKGPNAMQDAPVSQLPNELLTQIFIEATAQLSSTPERLHEFQLNYGFAYSRGYYNTEVVISHVCSQWRTLSLSLPSLWTSIYYVKYLSQDHDFFRWLETYLERSASQLLDIWLDLRCSRNENRRRTMAPGRLLTTCIPHVGRWRSFTYIPDDQAFSLEFLTELEHLSAPNLEAFCTSVANTDVHSPLPLDTVPVFKNGAPKMSLLHIDICGLYSYLLPLSNVSTCHITSVEDCHWYLNTIVSPPFSEKKFVNLTNLRLSGQVLANRSQGSITSLSLRHLQICNNRDFYLTSLHNWKLPLLETITFQRVQICNNRTGLNITFDAPNLHSLFIVDCRNRERESHFVTLTRDIRNVVISSGHSHSTQEPMKFIQYAFLSNGWPMLQDITVNLLHSVDFGPTYYLDCLRTRHVRIPLTLRVDPSVLVYWRVNHPDHVESLERICTIETLDDSIPHIPSPWPVITPAHEGVFGNLYRNLEEPLIKRYSLSY